MSPRRRAPSFFCVAGRPLLGLALVCLQLLWGVCCGAEVRSSARGAAADRGRAGTVSDLLDLVGAELGGSGPPLHLEHGAQLLHLRAGVYCGRAALISGRRLNIVGTGAASVISRSAGR